MKTSELKKIVEDNGCKYNSVDNWLNIRKQDDELIGYIDEKNINIFMVYDTCPKVIAQAILDYAYTPLEKREECEEEKKYWVVLPKRDLQHYAISKAQSISILSHKLYKTNYTLKELREIDFLIEIDGKWYMKLELEELKHD